MNERQYTDYALPDDLTHWDEFNELVSTIVDEVIPTKVPVRQGYVWELAKDTVLFILKDAEMRPLMVELLQRTQIDGYGGLGVSSD